MALYLDEDVRWKAIQDRDLAADGQFIYGVTSTGVFCRPSCPSRRPRRANVRFFTSVEQAEQAGFRPCLRCRPCDASRQEQVVGQVQALLDADTVPTLSELGVAVGMSPGVYKRGGRGVEIRYTVGETSLGPMLLAATAQGICALRFGEEEALRAELRAEFPQATLREEPLELAAHVEAVKAYLEGAQHALDLPLDVSATAFQLRVWRALRAIPYGQTRSYKEVAEAIGEPRAVRAVARACATNPVALVVPCHRVVRTGGELSGYRWGVDRKRRLLQQEGAGEV